MGNTQKNGRQVTLGAQTYQQAKLKTAGRQPLCRPGYIDRHNSCCGRLPGVQTRKNRNATFTPGGSADTCSSAPAKTASPRCKQLLCTCKNCAPATASSESFSSAGGYANSR